MRRDVIVLRARMLVLASLSAGVLTGCFGPGTFQDSNALDVEYVTRVAARVAPGSARVLERPSVDDTLRRSVGAAGISAYPTRPRYVWVPMRPGRDAAAGGASLGLATAVACTPSPIVMVSCGTIALGTGFAGGVLLEASRRRSTDAPVVTLPTMTESPGDMLRNAVAAMGARRGWAAATPLPSFDRPVSQLGAAATGALRQRGIWTLLQVALDGVYPIELADRRTTLLTLARVEVIDLRTNHLASYFFVAHRSAERASEEWNAGDGAQVRAAFLEAVHGLAAAVVDVFCAKPAC